MTDIEERPLCLTHILQDKKPTMRQDWALKWLPLFIKLKVWIIGWCLDSISLTCVIFFAPLLSEKNHSLNIWLNININISIVVHLQSTDSVKAENHQIIFSVKFSDRMISLLLIALQVIPSPTMSKNWSQDCQSKRHMLYLPVVRE